MVPVLVRTLQYHLLEKVPFKLFSSRFAGVENIARAQKVRFKNRSTASTSRNNLPCVLGQMHDGDLACSTANLSSSIVVQFKFPLITYFSAIEICLYSLLCRREALTGLRKREKIDRSPCSFTRKRRFTSRTSQAVKKNPPFS